MWDQRYGEPGFAYGTEPNDFLREHCHRLPVGPVLCLAEGEGRNAVFLAGRGELQVSAVDSSSVGLQKARALAAERGVNVETVVADLASYDLGQARWAGVVSIFCHLPPPLRQRVHAGVVEALRPGGLLILEAYGPGQLGRGTGGPPAAELLYDLDTLRAELAGLELQHAEELTREIHEGRYHSGTGAVVQVIGVKRSA